MSISNNKSELIHDLKDLMSDNKKSSTVDRVVEMISELIIDEKIKPGDKLPSEEELTKALNVSRTSIREAMKVLSAFGLINIKRGNGTFIAENMESSFINPLVINLFLTNKSTRDLVELREMMEFEIIKIILNKYGENQKYYINQMEKSHLKMKNLVESPGKSDTNKLVDCEIEFHKNMVKATDNNLIIKIYDFVLKFFRPFIKKTLENNDGSEAVSVHQDILDSLKSNDEEKSIKAINHSIEVWQRLYQNQG